MDISCSNVEELLREADIEGLIESGAPNDEYDSEAKDIAKALAKLPAVRRDVDSVVAILSFVWAKAFNLTELDIRNRLPAFGCVAQKLLFEETRGRPLQ